MEHWPELLKPVGVLHVTQVFCSCLSALPFSLLLFSVFSPFPPVCAFCFVPFPGAHLPSQDVAFS